jgi:hypothetical protein
MYDLRCENFDLGRLVEEKTGFIRELVFLFMRVINHWNKKSSNPEITALVINRFLNCCYV